MMIPLVDLRAQYNSIKEEIDEVISRVLNNTSFIMGNELEVFEGEFAGYCNTRYAIGVANGSDALILALLACGIGEGDEVITVPNTFIATSEAISHVGAKIIFVDVVPDTFNIDVSKIEDKITKNTKAIMPVHLYGQTADMDPLIILAKKYGLKIIEDAAQAHGAEYKGRKAGSIGDTACFSLYPSKNLGAYGDGGIITTNNEEIANKIKFLRNHGRTSEKYLHDMEGYSSRLDNLQAAILSVKLKYLDVWNDKRRENVLIYNRLLENLNSIVTPYVAEYCSHVYHLYVIQTKYRNDLREYLKSRGVATGIHYPIPLHLQPAYNHLEYKEGDFPITERVSQEILSLPMYPELGENQIIEIVEKIKRFHKENINKNSFRGRTH